MTQELKTLWVRLSKLVYLPEAVQAEQASRILKMLDEQTGDGSLFEPELPETSTKQPKPFMHLAGKWKNQPEDLSYNKSYLKGLGRRSLGDKE